MKLYLHDSLKDLEPFVRTALNNAVPPGSYTFVQQVEEAHATFLRDGRNMEALMRRAIEHRHYSFRLFIFCLTDEEFPRTHPNNVCILTELDLQNLTTLVRQLHKAVQASK